MKHWKMAYKLGTGLGSILLLTCFLGYISIHEMDAAIEINDNVVEKFLPELTGMAALQREFYGAVMDIRTFVSSTKQENFDEGLRKFAAARTHLEQLKGLVGKYSDLHRLVDFLTNFGRTLDDCVALAEQSRDLVLESAELRRRIGREAMNATKELLDVRQLIQQAINDDAASGNVAEVSARAENLALAGNIITAIVEVRLLVWQATYQQDGALLQAAGKKVAEQLPIMAQLRERLRTEAARTTLNRASANLQAYDEGIKAILSTWERLENAIKQSAALYGNAQKTIAESAESITVYVIDTSSKAIAATKSNERVFMGILGALLLLGLAIALLLTRSITGPLGRSTRFAQEVAAGRLNAELDVHQRDEVGQLAEALRSIPQMLQGIRDEYEGVTERISGGHLTAQGDARKFPGDFSSLVEGTNAALSRLCAIVELMPSSVVILNPQLRATYANGTARALAGQDFAGKSCKELFAREDDGSTGDALTIAVRTLQASRAETVAHPGGKAMDVDYNVVPMLNKAGQISCLVQFINDTTAIKTAQRTIMRVAEEAVEIANRVASTAEQLSAQVEQSEEASTITAERISETATSMEQMNSTVLEVARSAGSAATVTGDAKTQAEQGAVIVNGVMQHIADVEKQARQVKTDMEHLGQQAEAIDAIMSVISDIADQTNLLALNAAIEAARAGEAGRGFAVVADEVRKLAEKTVQATVQVGEAIRGIQQSAQKNIHNVDISGQKITEATALAQQAGESLTDIVALVDASADQVHTIAIAAEQQSSTSEEINRSLGAIHNASQETAKAMADASQAVVELSGQAQNLARLIDGMKRG